MNITPHIHVGWPQGIYLALWLLGLLISIAKHGQERKTTFNVGVFLVTSLLMMGLSYWGGFFS